MTLLLWGQCGRRKCQKCHDYLAEHRYLPTQKYNKWLFMVSPSKSKQASTQFLDRPRRREAALSHQAADS